MKDLVEFNLAEGQSQIRVSRDCGEALGRKEIAVAQAYADDISVISPSGFGRGIGRKVFT